MVAARLSSNFARPTHIYGVKLTVHCAAADSVNFEFTTTADSIF